ncbi:hypothetical protein KC678_05155 [Candidatus Dojkabacteria bacterium]|uniref:Uncharacterized protein n=1 Tax=Candidatus Dojkabacteria bacterium TaxID=2099670 RepID=A0A955RH46_9BACT|nr:hypothetical protein [Candidatus Dojkabacteria bacterium]
MLTTERDFYDVNSRYAVCCSNENWKPEVINEIQELIGHHETIVGTGPNLVLLYMMNDDPDTVCISYDFAPAMLS